MASTLRKHLHGRVWWQLITLSIICVVLLGVVAYDLATGAVTLAWTVSAFLVGLGVGFVVGRIFKLAWHEETSKVIMSLDRTSILLIIVYVAFRVFGDQLLGHYLQGAALEAISFAVLAGLLLGRVLSISRGVRRILLEQGVW